MGEVFAATQASLERTVAVKVLRLELLANQSARDRFLAEGLIAADLEHPNTVPIYEVGFTDDARPFYSMRLVSGTRWGATLVTNSLENNLSILLRVSDAVAFAHDKGVIHRDLKPDNVLVGPYGEILLVDWGLAASVGNPRIQAVSAATAFAGTPAYMPPEVALCDFDRIGKCSDVYCLGGILYEIVTGLRPHDGSQVFECLGAALRNSVQPTEKGGELVEIALRALATNPRDRYASVREFQNAIRAFSSHMDSLALTHQSRRRFEALPGLDRDDIYRECGEIIALYQQALLRWPENLLAAEGLIRARDTLAGVALRRGEFLLAQSQVRAIEQERKQYKLAALGSDSVADRIKAEVVTPDRRLEKGQRK
jgi:serine/threonine protein kinase